MKRLPHIIGITGYAQHGKDSIAKVLRYELGYQRHGFADQLKEMALAVNPIISFAGLRLCDVVNEEGGFWEGAKKYPEVRRFLQVLGTEGVRGVIGEGAWIEALAKKVGAYDPHFADRARIVVPDVRFVNEAEWIRRMGGEVWRVERRERPCATADCGTHDLVPFDNGVGQDHPSEREVAQICADVMFPNDGTLEELQYIVRFYITERGASS